MQHAHWLGNYNEFESNDYVVLLKNVGLIGPPTGNILTRVLLTNLLNFNKFRPQ